MEGQKISSIVDLHFGFGRDGSVRAPEHSEERAGVPSLSANKVQNLALNGKARKPPSSICTGINSR